MATPEEEARRAAEAAAQAAAQASAQEQADPRSDAAKRQGVSIADYNAATAGMENASSGHSVAGAVEAAIGDAYRGAKSAMEPTTYKPYMPNASNFWLGGTPTKASELAQGYQQDQSNARWQGAQNQAAAGQRAAGYTQQGQTGQQAFNEAQNAYSAIGGQGAAVGQTQQTQYNQMGQNAQFRPGVQAGYGQANAIGQQFGADQAAARGIVGQQLAFANQGPGPSAAQAQLQAGADRAQLANLSLARSGRGFGENAAALSQAVTANADVQAQTNQQAAALRAQEAANWRGQQLQAYGQAQQGQGSIGAQGLQSQGQAAQMAQYQAGLTDAQRARNDQMLQFEQNLGQGAYQFGQQNQLGWGQLGQNAQQFGAGLNKDYATLGENASQAGAANNLGWGQLGYNYGALALKPYEDQLSANIDLEKLRSENITGANAASAQASNANKQGWMSAGVGLLGGLISDVHSKEKIRALETDRDQWIRRAAEERDRWRNAIKAAGVPTAPIEAAVQRYDQTPPPEAKPLPASSFPTRPVTEEAPAPSPSFATTPQVADMKDKNKHKLSDENSKKEIQSLRDQVAALGGKTEGGTTLSASRNESQRAATAKPASGSFSPMNQDQQWASDFMTKRDEQMKALQGPPPEVDFRNTPGYTYQYKNPQQPGAAPGTHVGPMAQDLTHVPGVVQPSPSGQLGVDTGRLTMANTAAVGHAQRENDKLRAELEDLRRQYATAFGGFGASSGSF